MQRVLAKIRPFVTTVITHFLAEQAGANTYLGFRRFQLFSFAQFGVFHFIAFSFRILLFGTLLFIALRSSTLRFSYSAKIEVRLNVRSRLGVSLYKRTVFPASWLCCTSSCTIF